MDNLDIWIKEPSADTEIPQNDNIIEILSQIECCWNNGYADYTYERWEELGDEGAVKLIVELKKAGCDKKNILTL